MIDKERLLTIKNEIILSNRLIEENVLPKVADSIRRYKGDMPITVTNCNFYLNEIYPIIQYELPNIFYRNPRVFLKPRAKHFYAKRRNPLTGIMEKTQVSSEKSAKTQEHLLNYLIDKIRYKQEGRRVLMDALLFLYGVLWHGYKGEFGMTEENSVYVEDEQLFVKRISPVDFLFDPKVGISNIDEGDWVARRLCVKLMDIQEDKRLKIDAKIRSKKPFMEFIKEKITGGGDTKNVSSSRKRLLDLTDEKFRSTYEFIDVYEVFVRPTKKERREGKSGHILLLSDMQESPLREGEWPYKDTGWPAKILEFNEVPDQKFGITDIDVYGGIADHKNLIMNLQARNAESNSKAMIFYDRTGLEEDKIPAIESGQQNIIGVNGNPRDKISVVTLGSAASSELYLIDGRIQANLDEKSGVTDLKKGFLRSGEESATSVQIRDAGASARPAYRRDMMSDFLKDSLKYLNNLNQEFMPIEEAVRISGTLDIEWSENPSREEIQADVDVEIDVVSMLPENPEKEIQELNVVLNLMTTALNNQAVYTKLTQEGKTFNISPVIENLLHRMKIRNPDVFRNIKPEESMGFASVYELKTAQANVEAVISGQQPPSPPEEGQDHGARLGVYEAALRLQALEGKLNQALQQLAIMQKAVADIESEKSDGASAKTTKPTMT